MEVFPIAKAPPFLLAEQAETEDRLPGWLFLLEGRPATILRKLTEPRDAERLWAICRTQPAPELVREMVL